jgi:fumarate reductase subunit D
MIDWNVAYWTLIFVGSLPFISLLINLIRMIVLLVREVYAFNAYLHRLIKHGYIDLKLLNKAKKLESIRLKIAKKHFKQ